jgi:hypothetical protein
MKINHLANLEGSKHGLEATDMYIVFLIVQSVPQEAEFFYNLEFGNLNIIHVSQHGIFFFVETALLIKLQCVKTEVGYSLSLKNE